MPWSIILYKKRYMACMKIESNINNKCQLFCLLVGSSLKMTILRERIFLLCCSPQCVIILNYFKLQRNDFQQHVYYMYQKNKIIK